MWLLGRVGVGDVATGVVLGSVDGGSGHTHSFCKKIVCKIFKISKKKHTYGTNDSINRRLGNFYAHLSSCWSCWRCVECSNRLWPLGHVGGGDMVTGMVLGNVDGGSGHTHRDRKSTRLNSSHSS